MQPTKHAIGGPGQVILNERTLDAGLGVAGELVGFQEETALVTK